MTYCHLIVISEKTCMKNFIKNFVIFNLIALLGICNLYLYHKTNNLESRNKILLETQSRNLQDLNIVLKSVSPWEISEYNSNKMASTVKITDAFGRSKTIVIERKDGPPPPPLWIRSYVQNP